MKETNIKLNSQELERLVILLDQELDSYLYLPLTIRELDPEQRATYETLKSLYTRLSVAQKVAVLK